MNEREDGGREKGNAGGLSRMDARLLTSSKESQRGVGKGGGSRVVGGEGGRIEGGREWMDSVLCEGRGKEGGSGWTVYCGKRGGKEGGSGWTVCCGRGVGKEGGREGMDSVTMRLAVRWRGRMFIFRMGMLALDNLLSRCGLTLLYILPREVSAVLHSYQVETPSPSPYPLSPLLLLPPLPSPYPLSPLLLLPPLPSPYPLSPLLLLPPLPSPSSSLYLGSYQLCCILTKWKTVGFWRYI